MKSMKKRLLTGVIAFIMVAGCFSALTISSSAIETNNIVITIDPGHGGTDVGNTAAAEFYANNDPNHYESKHVYDISLYIKERLNQYIGVTVYFTREDLPQTAAKPSNESRPALAKQYNSDAFVSIHTNAATSTTANGAEIWVPDKNISYNKNIAVASNTAAQMVLDSMISRTSIYNRGLKTGKASSTTYSTGEKADSLTVIREGRKLGVPVVMLVETAFASNENDFINYLSTTQKRKEMGYAIADGLASYFNLRLLSTATTPYFTEIQKINNKTHLGLSSSLDGGVIKLNAKDKNITGKDQSITLNGYMGANGGIKEYLYAVNYGEWKALSGGADGEPSADFYKNKGLSNATKMGMFSSDSDKLIADLSAYEGQNVSVTFAARAIGSNEIVPFLLITNYDVPINVPANICATYGQKLSEISLPAGWVWADPSQSVGNAGTNARLAVFTASDYSTHAININIAVAKANPSYTTPTDIAGQFKAPISSITLPEGWAWADDSITLDELGEHKFTTVFTPTDSDNYNTVSVDVTIAVSCTTHIFENDCDTTCECGFTRETTHVYTNDCDSSCNICEEKRDVSHVFDNEEDKDCNVCGAVRAIMSVKTNTGGCSSSITSIFAIIISIAIGFVFTKKK